MVYAVIHKDTDWPDGFEEILWLGNRLKHYGYTVNLAAKVLASHDGPQYKVSIIKWDHSPPHGRHHLPKREEIGTYEDKTEAANMIRFLLSVVDKRIKERN
jgi:hypothetical protein